MNELIHLVSTGFRTSRVRVSYEFRYGKGIVGEVVGCYSDCDLRQAIKMEFASSLSVRELICRLLGGGEPFLGLYDRGGREILVRWSLA